MSSIPRIRPTLPLKDIISFLANLLVFKPRPEQQGSVSEFESRFGLRYNLPPGVCFSKARVAFYFLLKNMGLKAGGEVIISAIHVADFVNMIRLAGFNPVVVDLLPNAYTIDCDDLERKVNSNTALILITHLCGYATDMDKVMEISKRRGVPFIEDCSQALSSQYSGRPLGVFGQAAIFSLSLLKPVCTLSGGMVLSKDTALLNRLKEESLRLQRAKKLPLILEAIKNIIIKAAVNPALFQRIVFPLMRMAMPFGDYFSLYQKTNKTVMLRESMPEDFLVKFTWQQAVMGLSQLTTLEGREKERIRHGIYLYRSLRSHSNVLLPPVTEHALNSFWLFPLLVKDTDKLKRFLAGYGIDSSKILLSLLCAEKAFSQYSFECMSAAHVKEQTLFVPIYYGMSEGQLDYIVGAIEKYNG
ncbi:MAG: DegT/DnrJ/EryC1/StrS aminotransferase family protein [Candidatus Omnitrophota bacterium]|nr:DegT/DnrJ/EryC1/StrS aminotransferase family protein [Candidatus Omnitrophota bacterium]